MKYLLTLASVLFFAYSSFAQKVDYDKKVEDMGIKLITPTKPMANYVKAVRTGNLLFLSGHGPSRPDGTSIT